MSEENAGRFFNPDFIIHSSGVNLLASMADQAIRQAAAEHIEAMAEITRRIPANLLGESYETVIPGNDWARAETQPQITHSEAEPEEIPTPLSQRAKGVITDANNRLDENELGRDLGEGNMPRLDYPDGYCYEVLSNLHAYCEDIDDKRSVAYFAHVLSGAGATARVLRDERRRILNWHLATKVIPLALTASGAFYIADELAALSNTRVERGRMVEKLRNWECNSGQTRVRDYARLALDSPIGQCHGGFGYAFRGAGRRVAGYASATMGVAIRRAIIQLTFDAIKEALAYEEPKKVPLPFDKTRFIRSLGMGTPDAKLLAILGPLNTEAELLKAAFEYHSAPREVAPLPFSVAVAKTIRDHNEALLDEKALSERLKAFYHECQRLRTVSNTDTLRYIDSSRWLFPKKIDESLLQHPLFELTRMRSMYNQVYLDFITREEICQSHEGNTLNFRKFNFRVYLEEARIEFIPAGNNFSGNACPYINNTNVCLGENGNSIISSIKTGKVAEALTELFTLISTFNPDSNPYVGLDWFFDRASTGDLRTNNGDKVEFEDNKMKFEAITASSNQELPF